MSKKLIETLKRMEHKKRLKPVKRSDKRIEISYVYSRFAGLSTIPIGLPHYKKYHKRTKEQAIAAHIIFERDNLRKEIAHYEKKIKKYKNKLMELECKHKDFIKDHPEEFL